MIKIENTEVVGWDPAIRGMRSPMNSWEKSDSYFKYGPNIGLNDLELMKNLAKAGSEHAKYRRMIIVYCDITAPLYWWKEFDTYKVGTVANSCSTMHKLASRDLTIDDFSHEHLDNDFDEVYSETAEELLSSEGVLNVIIESLNQFRKLYLACKNIEQKNTCDVDPKEFWWKMIQLLPSSYNQRRTVMLNYEVLANIYLQRKGHKLDEWREFCTWIKTLPYAEYIITMEDK